MDIWSKVDSFLSHAGTIIAAVSLLAGLVNHKIRAMKASGEPVPEMILQFAALLNVAAINLDKTADLMKQAKSQKLSGASNTQVLAAVVAEVQQMVDSPEAPKTEEAPKASANDPKAS
jgi:hypothetical protein